MRPDSFVPVSCPLSATKGTLDGVDAMRVRVPLGASNREEDMKKKKELTAEEWEKKEEEMELEVDWGLVLDAGDIFTISAGVPEDAYPFTT